VRLNDTLAIRPDIEDEKCHQSRRKKKDASLGSTWGKGQAFTSETPAAGALTLLLGEGNDCPLKRVNWIVNMKSGYTPGYRGPITGEPGNMSLNSGSFKCEFDATKFTPAGSLLETREGGGAGRGSEEAHNLGGNRF